MAGGRLRLVARHAFPRGARNSTNVVYKRNRYVRRRRGKKAMPAKSFKIAYNKMLPVKEARFDMDKAMSTDTLANRTQSSVISTIGQGSQMNDRLGNSIYISYVFIKGSIGNNSTTKSKFMRIIILHEHNEGSLSLTTFSDLYLNSGFASLAPSGTAPDGEFPVNREQYRVYYDSKFFLYFRYIGKCLSATSSRVAPFFIIACT